MKNTETKDIRQCLVCGGPMRERTRKEHTTDGRIPKQIPIAKCRKCGSWIDLPNKDIL
jgi:hypothetical protein